MSGALPPDPAHSVPEETLDPADWEAFRVDAHRLVDDLLDFMAGVRDRPVWQTVPAESRQRIERPLPRRGTPLGDVLDDVREHILPYPTGNVHPRFWGWVMGNGTADGLLAEMVTATMNSNLGGGDVSPAYVEHRVVSWMAELMGFPREASGLLVNGATMASFVGLTVARHAKAGFDVRTNGMQSEHPVLVVYGSKETHSCVTRAIEILGIGTANYRRLPVDDQYRMDVGALRQAVEADVRAGKRPLAVVGTVGTVNTGASDDIPAIAEVARAHGMWLHVDGAFGAMARLSPELGEAVRGIELADSLAVDLHKWGYLPYGVACVLVRDAATHSSAFAYTATYLASTTRGFLAPGIPFSDRGIELSRRFLGLKVWMALRTHGVEKLGRLIAQNVRQARALVAMVESTPELELLAPAPLNVVNFRYRGIDADPASLDAVNQEILLRLQEQGIAMPSSTVLQGKFAIRVANTNHRTRTDDMRVLADAVVRLGREIEREPKAEAVAVG